MSSEEKEQSRETTKKTGEIGSSKDITSLYKKERLIAKMWGWLMLLTLVFGAGIIFFGLLWGTILMIGGIIIMLYILGSAMKHGLDRRGKINLLIASLISIAVIIVLYIYFQIFWYFG